jgi:molybdate transport system regulatory protein
VKTSARNMFRGQVTSIREGMVVCEVELTTASGLKIVSGITKESLETLGLAEGKSAIATIKASWVVLVKDGQNMKTSARNAFCGKISAIKKGMVAAEVVVDLADGTKVTSLITVDSATSMDMKVGDEICALVKAFSVILTVE